MLVIDILVNRLFTHQFPVVVWKMIYSIIHDAWAKGAIDIKDKYFLCNKVSD